MKSQLRISRERVRPLAILAALIAAAVAASAAAGEPNGNGLGVTTVPCAGGEITILAPGIGNAATSWNLTTDEHTVAKSFTSVRTFTPTGGGPPTVFATESKTYGVKQGLGPESVCTFSYGYPVEGGSVTVDVTTVVVAVNHDS